MNIADLPTAGPDINALKSRLSEFCEQSGITKFEPDDIVELLEDGEDVAWIVGQLKEENAGLDEAALTSLLSDIGALVATPEGEEEEEVGDEAEELPPADVEMPAGEMPDLSQIDLSELEGLDLPAGMELPEGLDMKQVQKLMDSPQGKFLTDFSLFCQEKGVEDIQGSMSDPAQMEALNAEWMETPRAAFDGKTPGEMLQEDPSLMPQKVETYRREEPRVGRNDPCPCGSGKKYKKCCGKGL
jgi:hypothetical protein